MPAKKTIYLICSEAQNDQGNRIHEWLIGSGVASYIEEPDTKAVKTYVSIIDIPSDCAIVFISDCATLDPAWQQAVREVSEGTRMIPIGGTENANYDDPNIVPVRVSEINYIRVDEHLEVNLRDALTIAPDFYSLKNRLLMSAELWKLSHWADEQLLPKLSEVRHNAKTVYAHLAHESDDCLISQLHTILEFLYASRTAWWKRFGKAVLVNAKRAISIFIAVAVVYTIITFLPIIRRSALGGVSLEFEARPEMTELTALRILESDFNPFSPESMNRTNFSMLMDLLDRPWQHSRLSYTYKWVLNDAKLSGDTSAVWTADGGGSVIKWDRISSQVIERFRVTESPLFFFDISEDETMIAAVGYERIIYFTRDNGATWISGNLNLEGTRFAGFHDYRLTLSEDGEYIATHNNREIIIFETQAVTELNRMVFDRIHGVSRYGAAGFAAVVRDEGAFYYLTIREGVIDSKLPMQVTITDLSPIAISYGRVAFVDENNQIAIWDVESEDAVIQTGIFLRIPMALTFVNEYTIAYNDRHVGTRLIDFILGIELGVVLPSTPTLEALIAAENQLVARGRYGVTSQDVTELLPLRSIEGINIVNKFTPPGYLDEDGALRGVRGDGIVRGVGFADDNIVVAIWDNVDGIVDGYRLAQIHGTPTIVGILDYGDSIFVGTSNGVFYERAYVQDGTSFLLSMRRIPTRSAIVAVYQTENEYYLLDEIGLYWFSRLGYRIRYRDDMYDAVRDRLRVAFSDDLFDAVSREVVELVGVSFIPGSDGRMWE